MITRVLVAVAVVLPLSATTAFQPRSELVWPLLRQSADNTLRTYITHGLSEGHIGAETIAKRLNEEADVSARRALILSLGGFTDQRLPAVIRQDLTSTLLRWYDTDPDAGVPAAIDWLLRHSRVGAASRALDWQQGSAIAAAERKLAGVIAAERGWYVSGEGHTFTIVGGPVAFTMGARAGELLSKPAPDAAGEPLHDARIPRSFAIASKEVTVAQFRRFLDANPEIARQHRYPDNPARLTEVLATFSPDDTGPQIAVTWYEAAMYCNWLSQQEGLPQSEWVYPVGYLANGLRLPANHLQRSGYRLPTETEWEYAARANTATARFFGESALMLHEYAWYSRNPPRSRNDKPDPRDPQRTWPTGQLKPNDFGLFDVYGNVWEWTHDRLRDFRAGDSPRTDNDDDVLEVTDTQPRVRRGGGFPYEAAMMRSAHRGPLTALPTNRRDNVGFRVARTWLRPQKGN